MKALPGGGYSLLPGGSRQDGLGYNSLTQSWPEIARLAQQAVPVRLAMLSNL